MTLGILLLLLFYFSFFFFSFFFSYLSYAGTVRRVLAHEVAGSRGQSVSRRHQRAEGTADSDVQGTVARPAADRQDGVRPGDVRADHGFGRRRGQPQQVRRSVRGSRRPDRRSAYCLIDERVFIYFEYQKTRTKNNVMSCLDL